MIETSTDQRVSHRVVSHSEARISPEAAIPLALVVAESIANAIEHGFGDGRDNGALEIRLDQASHERLAVEIEDNGRGLPLGFRLDDSNSLGLRIATMLAGQLGGSFTLSSASGGGASSISGACPGTTRT